MGPNVYQYTYDSPTNFIDPLGLWPNGTVSVGGTINVNLGFWSGQYSGGFVIDTQGGVGVYNTYTPRETERVVRDCAEAGVRQVWMYRAGGQGAVCPQAIEFCRKNGIRVVEGYCPYMFLPATAFPHRAHGFLMKLVGGYPAKAA